MRREVKRERAGRGEWGYLEARRSSSSAVAEEVGAEKEREESFLLLPAVFFLCFLVPLKMYFWLQCVQVTRWPICGGVEFLLTQEPLRSYFSLITSSSGLRKMLFVTKK
jgi:hypothetical protein